MPRPSVRGQLVDAALEQFHERGYNGCGVKDITDAAGVPKGSFYNHFESKEALARETIVEYGKTRRIEMLADTSKPPVQRIRDHFAYMAAGLTARDFQRGCLYGNFANEMGDQSPELAAMVEARFGRWSSAIAEVLREAQSDGTLAASFDVERAGRFLVNAWEGAVLRCRVTKTGEPFDDFFAIAFDTLLDR